MVSKDPLLIGLDDFWELEYLFYLEVSPIRPRIMVSHNGRTLTTFQTIWELRARRTQLTLLYHQLSGWCWNNPLSLVLISSNSSPDHLVENCLKLSDTVVWIAYYEAQMCVCSVVSDSCNPRTVAPQTPLSMGFSRQEYRSGTPFPSPGDLPNPGIEPKSSWQEDSLPLSHRGSPWTTNMDRRFKITWLIQNEMI